MGTLGKSALIQSLVKSGKLHDIDRLRGGWEATLTQMVANPFPGVDRALVIAGSDRRGAAYGLMEISGKIGVSPWYWRADVPVAHHDTVAVKITSPRMEEPSVRYCGIFINDEDWGLKPWAATNYEKDLRDIGPETYARVFELILRLKGNMVAPAMHHCTGAFYSHADSKVVADRYGILITTSHCEPMLFNNAANSEWNKQREGEWNYGTNASTVRTKFDDRLAEASPYENIYTVGMRGLHDEGMRGNMSDEEKVGILEQVMTD